MLVVFEETSCYFKQNYNQWLPKRCFGLLSFGGHPCRYIIHNETGIVANLNATNIEEEEGILIRTMFNKIKGYWRHFMIQ